MAHDVFISYSSQDKPIADAVCGTLEGKKIRCWIAPRDVLPGLPYGEALVEAIEASRVMVLVFSSSANKSPQVMREVERAVSKAIPIIPLRIEQVPPSKSLEYFISAPHWLDALTPPLEKHLNFLAETVHLLLVRHGKQCDPSEGETGAGLETVEDGSATIAGEMKPAHPKRWSKWLAVSLAVVLLLAGLLGLIIGLLPRNHSPPADDAAVKPEPDAALTVTNSIGMKLVLVKPGVFLMGSPPNEADHRDDEHQHEVEITRPFYVGVYEVTQEQYERVKGHNPSWFAPTGSGKDKVTGMDTRRFPVEQVSWLDAFEFCHQLSERPEEKENGRTYRLPTEAEWEYVCRGGPYFKKPSPLFHFGNSLSARQANFDGNNPYGGATRGQYLQRTTEVGSYPPNPLGLYDLHGNVCEWCADWYEAEYYKRSPRQDPQGPENGERRVSRGGSWHFKGTDCRTSFRFNHAPRGRSYNFGFRVVLLAGART